jgi:hypothetical protein
MDILFTILGNIVMIAGIGYWVRYFYVHKYKKIFAPELIHEVFPEILFWEIGVEFESGTEYLGILDNKMVLKTKDGIKYVYPYETSTNNGKWFKDGKGFTIGLSNGTAFSLLLETETNKVKEQIEQNSYTHYLRSLKELNEIDKQSKELVS